MKKICIMLSLALITAATIHTQEDLKQERRDQAEQEDLEKVIVSAHTKVFGVDNLYKTSLNPKDWDDVIANTNDFVKKNRDAVQQIYNTDVKKNVFSPLVSSTMQRNKELIKNYDKIKTASNDLVKTIKAAYADVIESQKPKDAKLIAPFDKKFETIKKNMEKLTTHLQDDLKILNDKIKDETLEPKKKMLKKQKRVVTVLHRLSLTLETTAAKAQRDLKK